MSDRSRRKGNLPPNAASLSDEPSAVREPVRHRGDEGNSHARVRFALLTAGLLVILAGCWGWGSHMGPGNPHHDDPGMHGAYRDAPCPADDSRAREPGAPPRRPCE